jgi:hypothetical protein
MDYCAFAAAGPLWLALERLLESMPDWFRVLLGAGVVLAFLALIALAIQRKP